MPVASSFGGEPVPLMRDREEASTSWKIYTSSSAYKFRPVLRSYSETMADWGCQENAVPLNKEPHALHISDRSWYLSAFHLKNFLNKTGCPVRL